MITLPLPPALNRMYRTGRGKFYKSDVAKLYEDEVHLQLRSYQPTDKPIDLTLRFYFGRRNNDIDSRLKSLLDVLQGVLYVNDSQVEQMTVYKRVDKVNPRVELDFKHMEE